MVPPNSAIELTFSVLNQGPDPAIDVELVFEIPLELDALETIGCHEDPVGYLVTCSIDDLAPNEEHEIVLIVRAQESATVGSFVDLRAVASTAAGDLVVANNEVIHTLQLATILDIPTLGQMGLIILSLMLVFAGIGLLRRPLG